jgi:hypothetical protein
LKAYKNNLTVAQLVSQRKGFSTLDIDGSILAPLKSV